MADTITINTGEKGVNKDDSSKSHIFHKTNFNMPVKDFFNGSSSWVRYEGTFDTINPATAFDLTGFSPGFEIFLTSAVFDWNNSTGSDKSINVNLYHKFYDTDGSTVLFSMLDGTNFSTIIPNGSWTEYLSLFNQGLASWEVDSNATYYVKASATGSGSIPTTTQNISFTNVPSTAELSNNYAGYIWVEGETLSFINAQKWKHSISGSLVSSPGTSYSGYVYIDGTDLMWVSSTGKLYKSHWKVKQFASAFTNGATSEENAGISNAGYLWVDSEFGLTHLAYIGDDGYKYLTGAGNDPYA